MRKKLLIFIGLAVSGCLIPSLSADQSASYYTPSSSEVVSKTSPAIDQSATKPNEEVIQLSVSAEQRRFADLERRIMDLERENRFQEERIRDMDRTIDDLRRRNLR